MRLSIDFSRTIHKGINELGKRNGKGEIEVKSYLERESNIFIGREVSG